MKLLSTEFLQPLITSSLLGPYILLSTMFSYALNLYSSINVRDQVPCLYKKKKAISMIINWHKYIVSQDDIIFEADHSLPSCA
jgi:hypothetical protein